MKLVPIAAIVLMAIGCAQPHLNEDARRVAVLKPFDHSSGEGGPEALWPLVQDGLRERGYEVVPEIDVRGLMLKHRYTIPEEINQFTVEELAREFGCDAVLYTTLTDYNESFEAASPFSSRVAIEVRLVDKSGRVLWQSSESAGTSCGWFRALGFMGAVLAGDSDAAPDSLEESQKKVVKECFAKLPLQGYDERTGDQR